jgi:hypothetical protein
VCFSPCFGGALSGGGGGGRLGIDGIR